MKKLKRVFGSVANLAGGRSSDHGSSSGDGGGGGGDGRRGSLSSARRSGDGSINQPSPQHGSYYSYETRSLDSFTSGQSSATSPSHTPGHTQDKLFTKLHKWAAIGDTNKLKKFIKKFEVDVRDSDGRTPLHHAAGSGREDAVLFLLGSKADAEARDHAGATPLLRAVERGQIHIAQMLLQRKVDIGTSNKNGESSVHLAARAGATDLLSLLLDCGGDCDATTILQRTPLHLACADNQEETAEALLRHGAHVNATNKEGVTPLMLAAKVGGVALVESLLDHGAATNPIDASRWTAADYARFTNHNQLYHRLNSLAQQHTDTTSLVPQGLLSVSDEGSDPTEAAKKEKFEEAASDNGDDNSWKDDSDVSSVKEKPKLNLAKFLPSSDESNDNITLPTSGPASSSAGPPKPPRLYTSLSSLASEGADTKERPIEVEHEEENVTNKDNDDDSWKSSSEEEEPKAKIKALGLFGLGSTEDMSKDTVTFKRSETRSGSRVGKEDILAELGMGSVQYHSSEEDVSFEEDEKPVLPLEGTPTKIILSRRSSVVPEIAHKKTPSPSHQPSSLLSSQHSPSSSHHSLSSRNLLPTNTNNESPKNHDKELSDIRTKRDSISESSDKIIRSRRGSTFSASPFKSPSKKSPRKTQSRLRKLSAFDSDSDECDSWSQKPKNKKKTSVVSETADLPLSHRDTWDSTRSNSLAGEVKETSFTSLKNVDSKRISPVSHKDISYKSTTSAKKSPSASGGDKAKRISPVNIDNSNSSDNKSVAARGLQGKEGTLGRQGTMQEVEEIWEANPMKSSARHSNSSSLASEASHKHRSKETSKSKKSEAGIVSAKTSVAKKVNSSQPGSKRGSRDVSDSLKIDAEFDDTAQDISDEDFASSGIEDLLDPMAPLSKPLSVLATETKNKPTSSTGKEEESPQRKGKISPLHTASPYKKQEGKKSPLHISSPYKKQEAKTPSPTNEVMKQTMASSLGMDKLDKSVIGQNTSDSPISILPKKSSARITSSGRSRMKGAISFSDDEGETMELQSSWCPEDELSEDGASTETEESTHINAALKDSLMAPLSSLANIWDVDQLRDLVRELRLKLEKEQGRRAASEAAISQLRHQHHQTRSLCAQQEEALAHHQQEMTRLHTVIRQLEYQIQCHQDSGQAQSGCVEEWRGRCGQLEHQCHSLQGQAQRQDQLLESLMVQLNTQEALNNNLQARLNDASAQTKYVSMKSCQTDSFLSLAASCQSTHSQTDTPPCLTTVDIGTQSDIKASEVEIKSKELEKAEAVHTAVLTSTSQDKVDSAAASTQTEQLEELPNKVSVSQEMGTQCEAISATSTGVQNTPGIVTKYSQTQVTHTNSSHVQTQLSGKEIITRADKQVTRDSFCQACAASKQAGAQTDPVRLELETTSEINNLPESHTQAQDQISAIESMLQNFTQDIKMCITDAAVSSQTSALEDVNCTLEEHLDKLNSNIISELQHTAESGQQESLQQLLDNIQGIQSTLQYQQEIIETISADANEIKSNKIENMIEGVDSGIKLKIEGLGKELHSIQESHESDKQVVGNIEASLKDLKKRNEQLLELVSNKLPSDTASGVTEELNDLKQQLNDHLLAVRNIVESGGPTEDSGVSISKGVVEKLDTIEKSLSLSASKNDVTEDLIDLQQEITRLFQDSDKKLSSLQESLQAAKKERGPEVAALEEHMKELKETTENLAGAVIKESSEQNSGLSEALEENFQIVHEQVRRLQQNLLQRINEVSERINSAEDQQGTRLARQVAEVAQQVAGVQAGIMKVQAWVDRGENRPPGDTLDQTLVSSLRATSDQTLTTLTQQNNSILKQLESVQLEVQQASVKGQATTPTTTTTTTTELLHLREQLREKDNNLANLQANIKDLQDTLIQQKSRAEVNQRLVEDERGRAERAEEQTRILDAQVRQRQDSVWRETGRTKEDMARLQQENVRLSSEAARVAASLEVEQQQRRWCEGQLQALQEARDAAEKRTMDVLATLPPPSLQRTPPTGRDQEDEAASKKQEAQKQEMEKLKSEKAMLESHLEQQKERMKRLDLQLLEAQTTLKLEEKEKTDLKKQLKRSQETIGRLQQDLSEARQIQEAAGSLEDMRKEMEGEIQARDSSVNALKVKVEALNKEKLMLKQDILTLKGEKLSYDLLIQEKNFSEEMQRKTEEQLLDLQKKIPVEYVSRGSLALMQKELENKYQRDLTTKLSELQRTLDEQNKQQESINRNRDAREQQLREELGKKCEDIVRLTARLSLGEEREDSWRIRHDRLMALYQQGPPHHHQHQQHHTTHGIEGIPSSHHITTTPASSHHITNTTPSTYHHNKNLPQDSLSVTLREINQHLKTPLATSTLLDHLSPPGGLHLGELYGAGGVSVGNVGGSGSVDSYHHTHADALDSTIHKYLAQNDRLLGSEDKPQARISPMQPSPSGGLPTLDQSCQDYVDLLKTRYGL